MEGLRLAPRAVPHGWSAAYQGDMSAWTWGLLKPLLPPWSTVFLASFSKRMRKVNTQEVLSSKTLFRPRL